MTDTATTPPAGAGAPVLLGTDHIELWVGNARQAAHFYRTAFGFDVVAYAGPETGVRDRASYVVQQGHIRLVLTGALAPEGPIADHVRLHGDGVRSIALCVDDAAAAYEAATSRGARPVEEPHTVADASGAVHTSAVATFGDTLHRFVERNGYSGPHLPGYRDDHRSGSGVGLRFVDHTVGNVEVGRMDPWVDWYHTVFNFDVFQEFDENDIATRYSALRSKVTRDPGTMITFPINEPAQGLKVSQIQEYLDYYRGPGVQHIALHTDDVVDTVQRMRDAGVEFLAAPASYYEALVPLAAAHGVREDLDHLQRLGILVDFEEDGYLLQIFTRPVGDRPTLFYEVIQRRGARGFGKGNFKALFEAIELEQAARGNL